MSSLFQKPDKDVLIAHDDVPEVKKLQNCEASRCSAFITIDLMQNYQLRCYFLLFHSLIYLYAHSFLFLFSSDHELIYFNAD